jgi:hypothetical protein
VLDLSLLSVVILSLFSSLTVIPASTSCAVYRYSLSLLLTSIVLLMLLRIIIRFLVEALRALPQSPTVIFKRSYIESSVSSKLSAKLIFLKVFIIVN